MAEIIIVASIVTFLLALSLRFLHHVIGSPAGNEYETGRIFSIWGRIVADGYSAQHNNESVRIWAKYKAWEAERNRKLYDDLENCVGLNAAEDKILIQKQFNDDIEEMLNRVESWRRPNPWMALGACFICFSTWVSCFAWCILIPYLSIPVLLFPILVGATVMLAVRIGIE